MQGEKRFEDVFLVQLVYFTSLRPSSEFRLYDPLDSRISKGVGHPLGLTSSLASGGAITLKENTAEWLPKVSPSLISLDPKSFAIARAVFWSIPGNYLTSAPDQHPGVPFDDEHQPIRPFWIIDSSANQVVSVSESLDSARNEFEDKVNYLASALGRAT
ncbi:hypothetical protein FJP69_19220 [Stenotrophomonas maltophilia]|nr:hypothetical protein FJP69_19220 [Stenotrophomonas maltophilia]